MRINVYSQELTNDVQVQVKKSNTDIDYTGVSLMLHSTDKLHHTETDDDRSAVTFWLPTSIDRRKAIAEAFRQIANVFEYGEKIPHSKTDRWMGVE